MDFDITDAREDMLRQLQVIEEMCFSVPWTEDMLRTQLARENHIFLAAQLDDGKVIGYIGLMYVLDEGYISNLAVAPRYRHQGVARKLIRYLINDAKEKKLAFLTLEVRESNTAAINLYELFGFQQVGRRKNYYEKPTEDALLYTRVLGNAPWMH